MDTIETDASMYHSNDLIDPTPWWLLDLGETRMIHDIQILTRSGCCSDRLHDIEVSEGSWNLDTDLCCCEKKTCYSYDCSSLHTDSCR